MFRSFCLFDKFSYIVGIQRSWGAGETSSKQCIGWGWQNHFNSVQSHLFLLQTSKYSKFHIPQDVSSSTIFKKEENHANYQKKKNCAIKNSEQKSH